MTYLVVSTDTVRLENEALTYAKNFNLGDVFWIKRHPDKKEITVDVINEMINQSNLVSLSGKKLFLVFEAELMNTAAQNKLLKTIENADDNTTVLFLCKNLTNILPTIKSRSIVRYLPTNQENLTLKKLAAENSDTTAINQAAQQLFAAQNIMQGLTALPVLTKPENFIMTMAALHTELKKANFPETKKIRIYQALAQINRNIEANCNATNAFDLLLLTLF